MSISKWVREGITLPRVAIYLKVTAVFFWLGAVSHLNSVMGLVGGPWMSKPWYFRTADLVLLPANLVIGWGLWRTRFWGVVGWVAAVVLLQAVPMLLSMRYATPDLRLRVTWYCMLATHAVMLGVFLLLLPRKRAAG